MIAQSGISFLIYLVAGIIWLVSNLLQQKRAKEKAEEMKSRREEREKEERRTGKKPERSKKDSIEAELEAFLGRLTGTPSEPQPMPRPHTAPAKKKVVRKPETISFDRGTDPTPSPTERAAAIPDMPKAKPGREIRKQSRIEDLDMNASFKEIKPLKEVEDIIVDLQDGKQLRQDALHTVRSMMIDLSNTTIKMPSMPIQSIRPVPTQTDHPDLKNKKRFRQALISTVLLENPKALQPRPFEGTH